MVLSVFKSRVPCPILCANGMLMLLFGKVSTGADVRKLRNYGLPLPPLFLFASVLFALWCLVSSSSSLFVVVSVVSGPRGFKL